MKLENEELLNKYFTIVKETKIYPSIRNLKTYIKYLFKNIHFEGIEFLDVGGGNGLFSFYARCIGAKRVVCLEPTVEGSRKRMTHQYEKLQLGLGSPEEVQLTTDSLQEFKSNGKKFDVILLHNVINHLDESACIELLHNERAGDAYKQILTKLYNLTKRGGKIIITDCSRYNVFALCKLKNPFAPTIEWHKHQSPYLWTKLLTDVSFSNPEIRWSSFNQLGLIGRLLLRNRVAAYFLHSHFYLIMEKI